MHYVITLTLFIDTALENHKKNNINHKCRTCWYLSSLNDIAWRPNLWVKCYNLSIRSPLLQFQDTIKNKGLIKLYVGHEGSSSRHLPQGFPYCSNVCNDHFQLQRPTRLLILMMLLSQLNMRTFTNSNIIAQSKNSNLIPQW